MTYYIPLALLVAAVAIISIILDRRIRARRAAKAAETTKETQSRTGVASRVTGQFQGLRERVATRKQSQLPKKFQKWSSSQLTDEGLTDWLTNLSDEGSNALTSQLEAFCADLNFELAWLVEGDLDKDPELKQVAEDVVVGYTTSCWQAALAQNDLAAFRTLRELESNPTSKKHRELIQELYSSLFQQDLVSQPELSEVFLSSENKRFKRAVKMILEAAETDRKKFNDIFKEVTASLNNRSKKASEEPAAEAEPEVVESVTINAQPAEAPA
jgi:hypothetical protein